jgi:hypothetical protein
MIFLLCGAFISMGGCTIPASHEPLTFKVHDFVIDCYSAKDMKVSYGNLVDKICTKGIFRKKILKMTSDTREALL